MERPDARQFLEDVIRDIEELPEDARELLLDLAEQDSGTRPEAIKAALMEAVRE